VSRALNDRADVNPLTRQRVREAAAKLGYSPNQSGRSLRRGRTDLVAMIVPSGLDNTLINTVFLSVLDGLKRRLGEHGLDLAIFLESGSDDRLGPLRRLTQRGLADALIIADTEGVDPRVDYLGRLAKPFVAFGRTRTSARHAWVDPDFEAAVEGAVERFVALGHRRIGLALPDLRRNYLDLVATGYRRAMRLRGLPIDDRWDVRRPSGERGGLDAADALLGADPRPTAVSRQRIHARGRALSTAERSGSAARPRHFHPRPPAGGARAISHSDADDLSNELDRDREEARRRGHVRNCCSGSRSRAGRRDRPKTSARASTIQDACGIQSGREHSPSRCLRLTAPIRGPGWCVFRATMPTAMPTSGAIRWDDLRRRSPLIGCCRHSRP
jgi:hypothetical protein